MNDLERIAPRLYGRNRYLVITPCRDEAEYLPTTIDTMLKQTVLPALWLIVDDGSKDATPKLVEEAARKHSWIRLHRRVDRGERAVGSGVVQAFNEGLQQINLDDYEYVCKLDADLGLPENYFESLIAEMEADSLLGNFSGKTYIRTSAGEWVSERMGDENAIGASKFYRVKCFREIGGFVSEACWDGIDGHMCRMMGWKAMSLDRPELRLLHYRPQGSSQQNVWVGRKRWGRGKYFMGSSLLYVAVVSLYRMLERPFVIGGLGIMMGYLQARWDRYERFDNAAYLKHLRRYEMMSLLFGKHRTMRMYHKRIETGSKP